MKPTTSTTPTGDLPNLATASVLTSRCDYWYAALVPTVCKALEQTVADTSLLLKDRREAAAVLRDTCLDLTYALLRSLRVNKASPHLSDRVLVGDGPEILRKRLAALQDVTVSIYAPGGPTPPVQLENVAANANMLAHMLSYLDQHDLKATAGSLSHKLQAEQVAAIYCVGMQGILRGSFLASMLKHAEYSCPPLEVAILRRTIPSEGLLLPFLTKDGKMAAIPEAQHELFLSGACVTEQGSILLMR